MDAPAPNCLVITRDFGAVLTADFIMWLALWFWTGANQSVLCRGDFARVLITQLYGVVSTRDFGVLTSQFYGILC